MSTASSVRQVHKCIIMINTSSYYMLIFHEDWRDCLFWFNTVHLASAVIVCYSLLVTVHRVTVWCFRIISATSNATFLKSFLSSHYCRTELPNPDVLYTAI